MKCPAPKPIHLIRIAFSLWRHPIRWRHQLFQEHDIKWSCKNAVLSVDSSKLHFLKSHVQMVSASWMWELCRSVFFRRQAHCVFLWHGGMSGISVLGYFQFGELSILVLILFRPLQFLMVPDLLNAIKNWLVQFVESEFYLCIWCFRTILIE